jgi:hypothetical protein
MPLIVVYITPIITLPLILKFLGILRRPVKNCNNVDLPDPDGPIIVKN